MTDQRMPRARALKITFGQHVIVRWDLSKLDDDTLLNVRDKIDSLLDLYGIERD